MGSRPLILAGLAVLLLAAGSVALILARDAGGAAARLAPIPTPTPTPTPTSVSASAKSGTLPSPAPVAQEPWEDVARLDGATQFGPALLPAVNAGVRELREAIAPCFERNPVSSPPRGEQVDPSPPVPTLLLRLVAEPGVLRVVDSEVEQEASAAPLVACARERVLGARLAAPGAAPGTRARLTFPLYALP